MAKIRQLAQQDRPREKMLAHGEMSLTNAELFAVLIGSCTQTQSSVELMQDVLNRCENSLAMLERMSINELTTFKGIGKVKAISIKAVAELGRRRSKETSEDIKKIQSAEDIYQIMYPWMRDLGREEFWAILLNNNQRIIRKVRLSQGGISSTAVDIRILMKEALLAEATQLIICHNHPSGSLRPSRDDIQLTTSVKQAASTLNIRLVDHVIITDGHYYSFLNDGKL